MKKGLVGLGIMMMAASVYLFPLFQDIVYWALMEIFGSFFRATLALYAITSAGFVAGLGLAAKNFPLGPLSFMKNPVFILAVLLAAAAMLYVLYRTPLGG